MSLSSVTISGTLKTNPEKRYTPTSIPVTNFLLQITFFPRGGLNGQPRELASQTVRISAWRDLAEECEKVLKTGDKVLVIGRAQVNAYTTNDGKKKRDIEIDATQVIKLGDVSSIEVPKVQEEIQKPSFQKVSQDLEPVSGFSEIASCQEEIPF